MKKQYQYETATIRLPNGKRKYIRAKTKEELKEKVDAVKRELALGIDIGDTTTFRDYATHWFQTTRKPFITQNSAEALWMMLSKHVFPYIGKMKLRDIKAPAIREVMRQNSGLCNKYQKKILSTMRTIFKMAVDDDIIIRSPVPNEVKIGGADTEEVEPLSPEQQDQLLEAAKGTVMYPIVYVLMHTGLRRGEVTGLMWSDIDYQQEVIHVRRHVVTDNNGKPELVDGAKTDAGVRDVPMPKCLISFLKEMQASTRSVYLFTTQNGTLYSSTALTRVWNTLRKRVPFQTKPHQLRHTYATYLFEQGLDVKQVQYILGHSDPTVTMNIYTHYRESCRKTETIKQVQEAFG